jgi:hypothetical protein
LWEPQGEQTWHNGGPRPQSLATTHLLNMWSSDQRPGFHSQRYQIFWEKLGLERGPLSLVSTTEELLERKVAAPV